MSENNLFKILVIGIVAFVVVIGFAITYSILLNNWTKDMVKLAIEKGQNPVFVKCAMEPNSSHECKTMMIIMATTRSDK